MPHLALCLFPQALLPAIPSVGAILLHRHIYGQDQEMKQNIDIQLAYIHWTKDPVVLRSMIK